MPRDPRPYITVDQGMPLHDKVRPLSDKAFRLLIEVWCWSKRNRANGLVPLDEWNEMSTAKARAELLRRNLAQETRRGIQMHDYLEHQLSAAEESGLTAKRTRASVAGNHKRWHLDLGVIEPSCSLCPSSDEPPLDEPDEPSHMGSHMGSQDGSHPRPNVRTTSGSASETSAAASPQVTPAKGGGGLDAEWARVVDRLTEAGVRPGKWTQSDEDEARVLCATHRWVALVDAALAGTRPDVLRGCLTRWRALQRPEPTLVRDCPEHGNYTTKLCTPCEAERKAASA